MGYRLAPFPLKFFPWLIYFWWVWFPVSSPTGIFVLGKFFHEFWMHKASWMLTGLVVLNSLSRFWQLFPPSLIWGWIHGILIIAIATQVHLRQFFSPVILVLDIRHSPRFSWIYQKLLWLTTRSYWSVFWIRGISSVFSSSEKLMQRLLSQKLLSLWLSLARLCFHCWSKTVGETRQLGCGISIALMMLNLSHCV